MTPEIRARLEGQIKECEEKSGKFFEMLQPSTAYRLLDKGIYTVEELRAPVITPRMLALQKILDDDPDDTEVVRLLLELVDD